MEQLFQAPNNVDFVFIIILLLYNMYNLLMMWWTELTQYSKYGRTTDLYKDIISTITSTF